MSKTKTNRTKLIYGALIILLVVLLVSSSLLLLRSWEQGRGLFPAHEDSSGTSVKVDGVNYSLKEDVQGILLIGLDKFDQDRDDTGYYNDQQADFVMLFALDHKNKTYSAIHLNRDTMTEINVLGVAGEKLDTFEGQLALAHTYGNGKEVSCRNTVDAVSSLLNDIYIDRYVSVTMDAVPVITDLVGGVEVHIEDDFTGVDDSLVMGETITLSGDQALNYVRSRYGLEDSSNSARMVRQQEYLSALFEVFNEKAKNDSDFILDASVQLSDYIVSNYSVNQLENLVENLSEYEFTEVHTIDGESRVGEKFMEFYADEDSVTELVLDLFYTPDKSLG